MKKILLIIAILALWGCAQVTDIMFVPSRIENYCRKISGAGDSGYEDMRTCYQQERRAKAQLSKMTIPSEIMGYCQKLSEDTGGSYQVMLACVQKEMRD